MRPGDFVLVERRGLVSAVIRLGQRLRKAQRPWARFSHAAMIVSERGDLVEALTRGVVRSRIEDYAAIPHTLVAAGLDEHDQAQAVAFAESCVGQSYGWLVILGIALRFLTPGRGLWFGEDGTSICSGLVAQALCRGWANFPANPASMSPAELGAFYRVPTS